jgi:hypothetical protein
VLGQIESVWIQGVEAYGLVWTQAVLPLGQTVKLTHPRRAEAAVPLPLNFAQAQPIGLALPDYLWRQLVVASRKPEVLPSPPTGLAPQTGSQKALGGESLLLSVGLSASEAWSTPQPSDGILLEPEAVPPTGAAGGRPEFNTAILVDGNRVIKTILKDRASLAAPILNTAAPPARTPGQEAEPSAPQIVQPF